MGGGNAPEKFSGTFGGNAPLVEVHQPKENQLYQIECRHKTFIDWTVVREVNLAGVSSVACHSSALSLQQHVADAN